MPNEGSRTKGRRVTVDLTPAAAGEVDRLRSKTGCTTAELFRYALTVLRIYVDARLAGLELRVHDPRSVEAPRTIELPFPGLGSSRGESREGVRAE